MPWISKLFKKDRKLLEALETIDRTEKSYNKFIFELSDALGYKSDVPFECESIARKGFLQMKIIAYQEKQRLIKLAEEVEKGKKLKRESK